MVGSSAQAGGLIGQGCRAVADRSRDSRGGGRTPRRGYPKHAPDLWHEFLACGGDVPFMEFDAYLHGAWSMPLHGRRVLEHVWWERAHLG